METSIEPFSAAIVYVADKYVESFPCKEKLLIYLQELCAELDINIMSIEKPIIMKGPWNTVIQMERFLITLQSELSQCISREENPSLQNLSQAFAHCSNLFTNKKKFLQVCSDGSCLSSTQMEATSDLSQCVFHKDGLDVQRKGGHAKYDNGGGETFQESYFSAREKFSDLRGFNENVKPFFHACTDGSNRINANISLEETFISGPSQKCAESELNLCSEEKKYKTNSQKSADLQIESEKESNSSGPSSSTKSETLRRSKRNIKTKLQNTHKTLLPSIKRCAMPTHLIRQESELKSNFNLNIKTALSKISISSDSIDETEIKIGKKKDNEDLYILPPKHNCVQKKSIFSSAEIVASKSVCDEVKNNVKSSRIKEKIPSPVIMKFRVDPLRKTEKIEQRTKSKTNKSEKLGKVFKCKECIYKTKNSKCLEEHMKRVHLARQFRCSECNKEFGFRKDLRRHMKCHGKAQHSCEVCGKAYKEANKLKAHKKTHALNYVKPQFSCQHCSKSFSTKYLLSYHINSEHLGMKCSFICPTCGKSFAQKNSYLQHANLHKGVKPFSCDICKMQFSYEKSLKEHASLHDETRNFKCSVCSKTFKQSSGLKIHMRIHNDTKDYVCAMCGKEFRQRQALLRHERIHAGEKPFECCLCTKFFGDSSVLRRHMLYVHKRSLKDWQKDTQRHSKSKNINSILAVSDSPCAEKEEVKCGNQNCGDDSFENAERKSSANHVVVQKKAFSQVLNTKDSSKSERPIPSLFLKSTDQENETYNFPEGNLQIDLFADGITPASTETNPLIPTERLSGTPNLMLSPIAQVIVGPFNKLKSCHSDSTNICQTDDIPFPESVNPS